MRERGREGEGGREGGRGKRRECDGERGVCVCMCK